MEFNEQKSHYLHPDFDEIDINLIKKKPSPLALLAETCQNIGSIKDYRTFQNYEKHCSPNGLKKTIKRCRSGSSSISSSIDLSKVKKIKLEENETCTGKLIELKKSDTTSETSSNSNNKLVTNILKFLKNSSNELTDSNKFELLQFLMPQKPEKTEDIKLTKKVNRDNNFNVMNGYHLDSDKNMSTRNSLCDNKITKPSHEGGQSKNTGVESEKCGGKSSTIKYCMYCGMLIPLLPMLLTHIHLEHSESGFSGFDINSPFHNSMSRIYNSYNPYIGPSQIKSDLSLSLLTDYINSSFMGLNNLIY